MKKALLLYFIFQYNLVDAQTSIVGNYKDNFGYQIEIFNDSTFEFNYQFDLASGWSIGKWKIIGDTIILTPTPIMDTLIRMSEPDSLVLSLNKTTERVSEEQFAIDNITSGGQLPDYVPKKLVFKKERLYEVKKNGKLKKKKVRGLFTKKKFVPRYEKIE